MKEFLVIFLYNTNKKSPNKTQSEFKSPWIVSFVGVWRLLRNYFWAFDLLGTGEVAMQIENICDEDVC